MCGDFARFVFSFLRARGRSNSHSWGPEDRHWAQFASFLLGASGAAGVEFGQFRDPGARKYVFSRAPKMLPCARFRANKKIPVPYLNSNFQRTRPFRALVFYVHGRDPGLTVSAPIFF